MVDEFDSQMGSLGGDTEKEPQSYSLIREFWDFLKHSKRWWLLPILIIMALLSVFIILSAEAPALMIYSMF